MHGKVFDIDTNIGIPNAVVDIWQASANGKYDFQDPENQPPNNLRGKFRTDADGNYRYYCLKPTGYSLPQDGTRQGSIALANSRRSVVATAATS
jgi:protocatechuate 3,4-dioxygenase beta subunit